MQLTENDLLSPFLCVRRTVFLEMNLETFRWVYVCASGIILAMLLLGFKGQ